MRTLFTTILFFLLSLSSGAQKDSFSVTVVPSKITQNGTGSTDLFGNPLKGATFCLAGYIYPGDYFDKYCPGSKDCGVIVVLTQDTVYVLPEHPGEVIGRWDMYGTALRDMSQVLTHGGTLSYGSQTFLFKKEFTTCPECRIATEGKDHFGGPQNEPYKRAITGGTTAAFRLMRGEVEQIIYKQPENKNETGGYNMKATFIFEKD